MKINKKAFEDFLVQKNDAIYHAAMDFVKLLHTTTLQKTNEDTLPYSQEIIGSIVDIAENTLNSMRISTCYPYYTDDEQPCYKDKECKALSKCPFHS